VVSTPLKSISQNRNLPQIGVKIKIYETTTQVYILNLQNLRGEDEKGTTFNRPSAENEKNTWEVCW